MKYYHPALVPWMKRWRRESIWPWRLSRDFVAVAHAESRKTIDLIIEVHGLEEGLSLQETYNALTDSIDALHALDGRKALHAPAVAGVDALWALSAIAKIPYYHGHYLKMVEGGSEDAISHALVHLSDPFPDLVRLRRDMEASRETADAYWV